MDRNVHRKVCLGNARICLEAKTNALACTTIDTLGIFTSTSPLPVPSQHPGWIITSSAFYGLRLCIHIQKAYKDSTFGSFVALFFISASLSHQPDPSSARINLTPCRPRCPPLASTWGIFLAMVCKYLFHDPFLLCHTLCYSIRSTAHGQHTILEVIFLSSQTRKAHNPRVTGRRRTNMEGP